MFDARNTEKVTNKLDFEDWCHPTPGNRLFNLIFTASYHDNKRLPIKADLENTSMYVYVYLHIKLGSDPFHFDSANMDPLTHLQ